MPWQKYEIARFRRLCRIGFGIIKTVLEKNNTNPGARIRKIALNIFKITETNVPFEWFVNVRFHGFFFSFYSFFVNCEHINIIPRPARIPEKSNRTKSNFKTDGTKELRTARGNACRILRFNRLVYSSGWTKSSTRTWLGFQRHRQWLINNTTTNDNNVGF